MLEKPCYAGGSDQFLVEQISGVQSVALDISIAAHVGLAHQPDPEFPVGLYDSCEKLVGAQVNSRQAAYVPCGR